MHSHCFFLLKLLFGDVFVAVVVVVCLRSLVWLIKGNGYEARQTSVAKEQTKTPRFSQVGRSTTLYNLLVCGHTLCRSYKTNLFLLASSLVWSKQLLCFMHGQGQNANKNLQQRTLSGFITFPSITYALAFVLSVSS